MFSCLHLFNMHTINTICICGAGTMGSGITQVSAMAGMQTIQFDVNPAMLEKSRASIEKGLDLLFQKGRIDTAVKEAVISRILFTTDINHCIADLVIEAIIENKKAKTGLFTQLAAINTDETIFATNTSSISISDIANEIPGPARVIGMHFFNPAPVMKLVEVVRAKHTSDGVVKAITDLARTMGKVPVVCKDAPGFIVNRVARPYYLEAMKLIEDGHADFETVDTIMEASGFKMGPFKLMDLIGLDINYSVSGIVWEALGKPERLKPSLIQAEKVEKGALGRKTGSGFYNY